MILTRRQLSTALITTIIAGLFFALTWPIWRWLWSEWRGNPYYSHGPLIVLISAYLAWRKRDRALKNLSADNRGLILVGLGIAAVIYFVTNRAMYLSAFASIVILAGLIWVYGGFLMLKELAFPMAFLALMVPLPFIERSTLPLALWTGVCSGGLVQWLGLDVAVTGSAVSLPNTSLQIGAQCSGINSIIALFALTTLAAYALKGPLWGRLGLVALAIPLAMLGNILRVSNLIVVARYMGTDAGFRFYHDYSGPVFFVIVLLMLIPITRLLQCRTLRYDIL